MNTFDTSAKGVYLITVTPFTDGGALDLASTDRMVDFCLDKGVTGLTILGIMGEATKLTMEESRSYVRRVLARVQGKVPVVVGASAMSASYSGCSLSHSCASVSSASSTWPLRAFSCTPQKKRRTSSWDGLNMVRSG